MKIPNTSIIVLFAFLLIITGCTGVTGNPARPPTPASSGGGCGVAAPIEQPTTTANVVLTQNTPRTVAL